MYVIATVVIEGEEYEVGADVTYEASGPFRGHEVGEPDVSAPDCRLKVSRLIDPATLPEGWSDLASEALIAAHEGAIGDMLDSAADARRDLYDFEDECREFNGWDGDL